MRPFTVLTTACLISFLLCSSPLLAGESAEAVYQKFHDALVAGDLDAMLELSPAATQAEISAYTPEQKEMMMKMLGSLLPKSISILGLTPGASADAATLYASGMGASLMDKEPARQYGTISMLKEGGEWKVGTSSWNNKPPQDMPKSKGADTGPVAASAAPVPPGPIVAPAAPATAPGPVTAPAAAVPVTAVQSAPPPAAPAPPRPPEKKKPVCIIKQVMTNAEIDACRQAAAES